MTYTRFHGGPMPQMLNDASEAAERVAALLSSDQETYSKIGTKLRALSPAAVATIARGSSDHAANYASYLIPMCTRKVVASVAPSLISVLKAPLDLKNHFVLAISQSGHSPDIISAVTHAKESGALTAAIVNDTTSPIAHIVDFLLPQHAGGEGIAATKTVLCTLTAIARLTAEWSGDRKLTSALAELPAALKAAYASGLKVDDSLLKGCSSAYVLSRGLGLSSALELSLKLKETCGLHAEAFSTAEVRHGPREIVGEDFMIIALALGPAREDILATAQELKAQGSRLLVIDEHELPRISDSRLAPLLVLQHLYPWLARASVALGLDPDRPKTLKNKVIKTV